MKQGSAATPVQNGEGSVVVFIFTRNWLIFQAVRNVFRVAGTRAPRAVIIDSAERTLSVHKNSRAVAILDIAGLPATLTNCLEVCDRQLPGTGKLLLGDFSADEMCRFLCLGIRGFIRYREVETKMSAAVRSIAKGRLHVASPLLHRYVEYTQSLFPSNTKKSKDLTPRQVQILTLLERRHGNKEISSALQISENTVKFHLAKLFGKLGVHDRHAVTDLITSGVLKVQAIRPPEIGPVL
jgi:DNA-binding NarL/FixJ family response regulator